MKVKLSQPKLTESIKVKRNQTKLIESNESQTNSINANWMNDG